jgi:hypothetical protein
MRFICACQIQSSTSWKLGGQESGDTRVTILAEVDRIDELPESRLLPLQPVRAVDYFDSRCSQRDRGSYPKL